MKKEAKKSCLGKLYGFTLVELLVVISIIALLLSILMPSLGKARTQAKVLVCGTQLRQLGLGVTLYMGDSSDHYPPFYLMDAPDSDTTTCYDKTSWPRLIQRYIDGSNSGVGKPFTQAFYCPLGPTPGKTKFTNLRDKKSRIWPANNSHYVTYGYNSYALGDSRYFGETVNRKWNTTPTTSHVRGSEFLVMVDNTNFFEASSSAWASPSGGVTGRAYVSRNHPNDAADILYGDMHVGSMSRKKLDEGTRDQYLYSYPWKVIWEKK